VEGKVGKKAKRPEVIDVSPEVIEVNSQGAAWAADGAEHEQERALEPLQLLRKYWTLGKAVREKGTNLDFNGIFLPKEVRTQLEVGREYYTLGCLHYFMQLVATDHPDYVKKCINIGLGYMVTVLPV
jgi:hypothetical protein